MRRTIPQGVRNAVRLFKTAAKSTDHFQRVSCFENGINTIRNHMSQATDPPNQDLLEGLEREYLGRLLHGIPDPAQVNGNREENISVWCNYLNLMLNNFRDVKYNLKCDFDLREKVSKFFIMIDEEPEILERLIKHRSNGH